MWTDLQSYSNHEELVLNWPFRFPHSWSALGRYSEPGSRFFSCVVVSLSTTSKVQLRHASRTHRAFLNLNPLLSPQHSSCRLPAACTSPCSRKKPVCSAIWHFESTFRLRPVSFFSAFSVSPCSTTSVDGGRLAPRVSLLTPTR